MIVVLLAIVAISWHFSDAVLVPDHSDWTRSTEVEGLSPDVGVEADVFAGNPPQALGLSFADVDVRDELGPMPAWSLPGRGDTWAIVVHGINGTPQVGLRLVPTLHRLHLPTLLIAYREDLGAPPSPDGFHHWRRA